VVMRLAGLSSHGACSRGVPLVVGQGSGAWWFVPFSPLSLLGPGTNVLLVGLIPKQPRVLVFSAPCGTSWL
jgi:hypothetical protein